MKACQLFSIWKIFEKEYALINRECGPFEKIFVANEVRSVRHDVTTNIFRMDQTQG